MARADITIRVSVTFDPDKYDLGPDGAYSSYEEALEDDSRSWWDELQYNANIDVEYVEL